MNLLCGTDPRIQCVKEFDCNRMNKGKSAIISDAIRYASQDFDISFGLSENGFEARVNKGAESIPTSNKLVVKKNLKEQEINSILKEVRSSNWQGLILKSRYDDESLINKAFTWLTKWKNCPVDIVNELQSIHLQTTPTLTFQKFRGGAMTIDSTYCRLCSSGNESVKHILSNCTFFLPTSYKRRHDKVLQWILFHFLEKYNLIERCPAWYSKIAIKPFYEMENVKLYWDIPEYYGNENEDENQTLRPDGKIILVDTKEIYILEMSVPWLDNRNQKFVDKELKYVNIIQRLKIDYPEYNVKQLTFIMDGLGGYSKELVTNLETLKFSITEIDTILYGMQKIVLSEAVSMTRQFKIRTQR